MGQADYKRNSRCFRTKPLRQPLCDALGPVSPFCEKPQSAFDCSIRSISVAKAWSQDCVVPMQRLKRERRLAVSFVRAAGTMLEVMALANATTWTRVFLCRLGWTCRPEEGRVFKCVEGFWNQAVCSFPTRFGNSSAASDAG